MPGPGRVLRVLFPPQFPSVDYKRCRQFPTLFATRNCPYPGLMVEVGQVIPAQPPLQLIQLLANSVGLEVRPLVLRQDQLQFLVGQPLFRDGRPAGQLELLLNGTVDLVALGFQKTAERERWFAFSSPLYSLATSLLVRTEPRLADSLWSFFRTYSLGTWQAFLAALLLQVLVGVLVRRWEQGRGRRRVSVLESAWQMLRLQLMQPEKIRFESAAGKFSILFFSLIQCAVLLGVFSSWILSSIISDSVERPPFDGLAPVLQRLRQGRLGFVSAKPDIWFFELVHSSAAFPYDELRAALALHPLRRVQGTRTALRAVEAGGAVTFAQEDDEATFFAADMCGLQPLTREMPTVTAHLMLRKDSPLSAALNASVLENRVLISVVYRKYRELLRRRAALCLRGAQHHALGIFPYLGLLLVCLALLSLAGLVFLGELVAGELHSRPPPRPE